jgi:hypothetical protein
MCPFGFQPCACAAELLMQMQIKQWVDEIEEATRIANVWLHVTK